MTAGAPPSASQPAPMAPGESLDASAERVAELHAIRIEEERARKHQAKDWQPPVEAGWEWGFFLKAVAGGMLLWLMKHHFGHVFLWIVERWLHD